MKRGRRSRPCELAARFGEEGVGGEKKREGVGWTGAGLRARGRKWAAAGLVFGLSWFGRPGFPLFFLTKPFLFLITEFNLTFEIQIQIGSNQFE